MGAGRGAGFLDNAYVEKGARVIGDRSELFKSADVILQVRGLGADPEAGNDEPSSPLFAADNTLMLFGDARKVATDLLSAIKEVA